MLYSLKPTSADRRRTLGLTVQWQPRLAAFRENFDAYMSGPKPTQAGHGTGYFRDAYVRPYWPSQAVVMSLLGHLALVIVLSLPIWKYMQRTSPQPLEQLTVTWDAPAQNLPPVSFPGQSTPPGQRGKPGRASAGRGNRAIQPRQTILSTGERPSQPRQTAVRTGASPEPPNVSSRSPEIELTPGSSRPRLGLSPSASAPLPFRTNHRRIPAAPDVPIRASINGQLNFPASLLANAEPRMPANSSAPPRSLVQPKLDVITAPEIDMLTSDARSNQVAVNQNAPNVKMPAAPDASPRASQNRNTDVGRAPDIGASTVDAGSNQRAFDQSTPAVKMPAASKASPRQRQNRSTDAGPAPDIKSPVNADAAARQVVSVTPSPVPPAPEIKAPSGSPPSRVPISPALTQPKVAGGPGSPGGGPGNAPGGQNAPNSTKAGPGAGTSVAGNERSSNPPPPAPVAPSAPAPSPPQPQPEPMTPVRTLPALGMDRIDPGATPEQIFGEKKIYTLYVNMPNVTSAMGNWVLNFAELNSGEDPSRDTGDLSSPVPVRKVDPKYPDTLMSEHVVGEVVLYAIIRRDGSVDGIQVLKGVEPELDQNSMEALARWRFRPSMRNGAPVEIETVVHIPFRSVTSY